MACYERRQNPCIDSCSLLIIEWVHHPILIPNHSIPTFCHPLYPHVLNTLWCHHPTRQILLLVTSGHAKVCCLCVLSWCTISVTLVNIRHSADLIRSRNRSWFHNGWWQILISDELSTWMGIAGSKNDRYWLPTVVLIARGWFMTGNRQQPHNIKKYSAASTNLDQYMKSYLPQNVYICFPFFK